MAFLTVDNFLIQGLAFGGKIEKGIKKIQRFKIIEI